MSEVLIYETERGQMRVEVRLEAETVWLSLNQMTELFGRDKSVISRHLQNIFQEGELVRDSVVALFAITAADGKTYQVDYFNLDTIISVGYRVNSTQATRFRQWATRTLREHLVQGYTLNSTRLAERGISEAQQARHSGASRNPAGKISRKADKTAMLFRFCGAFLINWIPACAGMTLGLFRLRVRGFATPLFWRQRVTP